MTTATSLRERKKLQTKAALTTSAYKLFKQHGYSRTSIEAIAADANFAPRTFFLHFSSKEDLLFPDAEQLKSSLQAIFNNRGAKKSALQTLQQWILSVAPPKAAQELEVLRMRKQIIDSEQSLRGREKLYLGTIETLLAVEIAKDMKTTKHAMQPKMAAAAAIAVFASINTHVGLDLSTKEAEAYIEQGIAFIEGGLKNIQPKTGV